MGKISFVLSSEHRKIDFKFLAIRFINRCNVSIEGVEVV